jgi:hypothetical protein
MDKDIEELRALVKQNLALTEDINHTLRKMRRAAAWGRFFQTVWWIAVIAVSGAAYYYYLQPNVDQIEHFYNQFSSGPSMSGSSFDQQVARFFENLHQSQ